MKSYFAKLADRATHATLQVLSGVHSGKAPDPFEDAAPPQRPLPSADFAESERMTRKQDGFAPGRLFPTVPAESDLLPSPVSNGPPMHRIPGSEQGAQEQIAPAPPQVTRREATKRQANTTAAESSAPAQPPESGTARGTSARPDEETRRREGKKPSDDEQTAEGEDERSFLLHQADDFMRRLIERSHAPKTGSEDADAGGSDSVAAATPHPLRHEESPQLQPARSAERISERESARPSLVIGKLMVEVMPPAPPPTAPVQRVVVVRGTRREGGTLYSSRRFGLGQF